MSLFPEDRTDDESWGPPKVPMTATKDNRPNFAVISILFVAALMIGMLLWTIVFNLLESLHWPTPLRLAISLAFYFLFIAFCIFLLVNPFIDRSEPKTKKVAPDTSRLFHIFQVGALGTVFLGALLTGHGNSPALAWVAVVYEIIVGLFYLAYIGFSLFLRYPPPKSIYTGILWVILCAWYSLRVAIR